MIRKTVPYLVALAFAVLFTGAAQAAELFDFTGISDGAGFNGAVDQLSVSGNYTFTGAGFLQENATTIFMFQDTADPPTTVLPISSQSFILDPNDVVQQFTVNSVDWRAFGANGGNTASLVGFSGGTGGTEEWRISGPQDIDPPITFNSPTTGSFANQIDTVFWDIPDYLDGTFGQTLDNLSINVIGADPNDPPPPNPNLTTFDFESNASTLFFNGTTTQTIGDHTLTIDVGNLCDRIPGVGAACGSGGVGSNAFSFAQTNLNIGDPINLSMTIRDPNNVIVPFNLQSIDFANSAGVSATMKGIESLVEEFSVSVPGTSTSGTDFLDKVTQTVDENSNPLGDHLISNVQIFFTNDTGGFKFPAIDNIVVDLGLSGPTSADFDSSGIVDGLDFLQWQRGDTPEGGSQVELALWESQYGGPPPISAAIATVPEPTTAVLLLSFGLALVSRRHRPSSR